MKKHSMLIAMIVTLAGSFSPAKLAAQKAEHVVLITVDGFRPAFYLDSGWKVDNIKNILKSGTYALGENSVFPSMTYPSHTTIVTGVRPAKHGVYYNSMFEPNGSTGKIYWNDSSIKVPTLWTAAKQKGLKSAAMFWPVSADAPVMYNIPDIGSLGEAARIRYSKPAGIIAEMQDKIFHDTARINYGHDQNVAKMAAYVIKKDKPNLMTIHLFGVDHYSHQDGREGPAVTAAIAAADSAIGIIVKGLKDAGIWEKTVFIITGDHGFVDVTTSVSPNVWLKNAGLLNDIKSGDWKAQFFSVSGSTYLNLKDKNDKATADKVLAMLNALPAEEKKLFRILSRAQLNAAGANPDVAFALTAENGASFGNALTGEAVKPRNKGGAHGHFPDFKNIQTGFIVSGPGIVKGGKINELNAWDIAPFIAKLLGLSLPSAEGRIPEGLMIK